MRSGGCSLSLRVSGLFCKSASHSSLWQWQQSIPQMDKAEVLILTCGGRMALTRPGFGLKTEKWNCTLPTFTEWLMLIHTSTEDSNLKLERFVLKNPNRGQKHPHPPPHPKKIMGVSIPGYRNIDTHTLLYLVLNIILKYHWKSEKIKGHPPYSSVGYRPPPVHSTLEAQDVRVTHTNNTSRHE